MAEITLRAFPSKSTPTPTYVASYFVVRCMINSLSVRFGFTLPALYNTAQLVTIHIVTCSFSQLVTMNIIVCFFFAIPAIRSSSVFNCNVTSRAKARQKLP